MKRRYSYFHLILFGMGVLALCYSIMQLQPTGMITYIVGACVGASVVGTVISWGFIKGADDEE